jgi:polysaccharide export outer membrane protein
MKNIKYVSTIGVMMGLLFLAGCAGQPKVSNAEYYEPVKKSLFDVSKDEYYRLQEGDKILLNIDNEADLSGELTVDAYGMVSLPVIGKASVAGQTVKNIETYIADLYQMNQVLNDPKVSIDVLTMRPVYIMGEVNRPGKYPYNVGMTVLSVVASAGGFTDRADEADIVIERVTHETKKIENLNALQETKVKPGDIIKVEERLF